MRAAMYYNNHDLRLQELDRPGIGPGELLIKVMASGICGSDVMEWYRLHKAPLVLGHEIAGQVVEVGAGVTRFAVGDRVTATHHVPCHTCHHCLTGHQTVCDTLLRGTGFDPGGFCEYLRLPAINVEQGTWKLPAGLDYDQATFMEPLACVLRGQQRAGLRPGMSVLVLGSGLAGLLHVHLAAATGAGLVAATDLSPYRLEAARRFGADLVLDAGEEVAGRFRELNHNRGPDLVIVCATTESVFTQAMEAVGRGGTILFFAPAMAGVTIPLPVNDLFWRRDVTITTTYAGSPADCVAALELIRRGRVRVAGMISHRLGLADAATGFRLTAEAGESIKVIIRPQE